jgi:predicted nuclease of predicted toxin-antitoxin system
VATVFRAAGHEVLLLREKIAPDSPDPLVCAVSEANDAILVIHDPDMKQLARRRGLGQRRYRKLSLIKLTCRESRAAARVVEAMSLIVHEWNYGANNIDRRMFIEIGDNVIRIVR